MPQVHLKLRLVNQDSKFNKYKVIYDIINILSSQDMEQELQSHINSETKEDIKQLYKHADIANREMGEVKNSLGMIETDIAWIKKEIEGIKTTFSTLDSRVWWILGSVVSLGIIQILIKIFIK